jgi:hypothetical protein
VEKFHSGVRVNAAILQIAGTTIAGRIYRDTVSDNFWGQGQPSGLANVFLPALPERLAGLRLRAKSFEFGSRKAIYLGSTLGPTGIDPRLSPNPNHVKFCFSHNYQS